MAADNTGLELLSSPPAGTEPMQPPPRFLFVDINQHCNLKCRHCLYWTRKEVALPGHISVARRSEIILEFAQLNPAERLSSAAARAC